MNAKRSLSDLAGLLTNAEADEMEEEIQRTRAESRKKEAAIAQIFVSPPKSKAL